MGDQVHMLLERQVPELEDLRDKGLFSKIEIQSIVKRRSNFEYLCKRRSPLLLDFKRYAEYELNLSKLRKARKKNLGIVKGSISDYAPIQRLQFIYERAIKKFRFDLSLWKQYISFCQQENCHKTLNKIFPRVLQLHPLEPSIWQIAACYEFETNNNIDGCRAWLQRGLRMNPTSKMLWLYFFEIELQYILKLRERKRVLGILGKHEFASSAQNVEENVNHTQEHSPAEEDEVDSDDENELAEIRLQTSGAAHDLGQDELSLTRRVEKAVDKNDKEYLMGAIPKAIFRHAVATAKFCGDVEFYLSFLGRIPRGADGIWYDEDFFDLVETVYDAVRNDASSKPESWDARARWCADVNTRCNTNSSEKYVKLQKSKYAACSVFEESILEKHLRRTPLMWEFYALYLSEELELLSDLVLPETPDQERTGKRRKLTSHTRYEAAVRSSTLELLGLFRRALEEQTMTEKMFCLWVQVLLRLPNIEEAVVVCELSIRPGWYPYSCSLWMLLLRIRSRTSSNPDDILALHERAVQACFSQKAPVAVTETNHPLSPFLLWNARLDLLMDQFSQKASNGLHFAGKNSRATSDSPPGFDSSGVKAFKLCIEGFHKSIHAACSSSASFAFGGDWLAKESAAGSSEEPLHYADLFRIKYITWLLSDVSKSCLQHVQSSKSTTLAAKRWLAFYIEKACRAIIGREASDSLAVSCCTIKPPSASVFLLCVKASTFARKLTTPMAESESLASKDHNTEFYEAALKVHSAHQGTWLSLIRQQITSEKFSEAASTYRRALHELPSSHHASFIAKYQKLLSKLS